MASGSIARLSRGRANVSRLDSHRHLVDGIRLCGSAYWHLRGLTNLSQQLPAGLPPELSVWFGAALIAIGAIVNLFSAQRFMHLVGELNRDQFADRSLSRQRVIVALFLAMLGIAMTIYLTFFLTQPLHGLHATVAGIAISK
jgi:hypothetical protein